MQHMFCFDIPYSVAKYFCDFRGLVKKTIRENLFCDHHVYNLQSRTCSITESVSNHGNFTTEICFFLTGFMTFHKCFGSRKLLAIHITIVTQSA